MDLKQSMKELDEFEDWFADIGPSNQGHQFKSDQSVKLHNTFVEPSKAENQIRLCNIDLSIGNFSIAGMIVGLTAPKEFQGKKDSQQYVIQSFFLKDDFNVVECKIFCSVPFYSNNFPSIQLGDMILIVNPDVSSLNEADHIKRSKYSCPPKSIPFTLSVSPERKSNSRIELLDSANVQIPCLKMPWENQEPILLTLDQIDKMQPGEHETCRILFVVQTVYPENNFVAKTGRSMKKREVLIADSSGSTKSLVLWDYYASLAGLWIPNQTIFMLTGVKISEYQGRSNLSPLPHSIFEANPQCKGTFALKKIVSAQQQEALLMFSNLHEVASGIQSRSSSFMASLSCTIVMINLDDTPCTCLIETCNGCGISLTSETGDFCKGCGSNTSNASLLYNVHVDLMDSTGHLQGIKFPSIEFSKFISKTPHEFALLNPTEQSMIKKQIQFFEFSFLIQVQFNAVKDFEMIICECKEK